MKERKGMEIKERSKGRNERKKSEIREKEIERKELIIRNKGEEIGVKEKIKNGKWGLRRIDIKILERIYIVCIKERGGG